MSGETEESQCSSLLSAALNGTSDMYIVRETIKRLDKELEESGKSTFTIGDLRRIMRTPPITDRR